MHYANGETIELGDHIWWNEGAGLGFIVEIAEKEAAFRKWGLDEPSFFINPGHPFEKFRDSVIAHSQSCVKDEGIDRLTPQEEDVLAQCYALAVKKYEQNDWRAGYTLCSIVEDCTLKGFSFTLESDGSTILICLKESA